MFCSWYSFSSLPNLKEPINAHSDDDDNEDLESDIIIETGNFQNLIIFPAY